MTNGVVCFAVMLFPCSTVEIAGTSPIRADNDFIPRCFSVHTVCVCVSGERTRGGAREFVCVRGKKYRGVREKQKECEAERINKRGGGWSEGLDGANFFITYSFVVK